MLKRTVLMNPLPEVANAFVIIKLPIITLAKLNAHPSIIGVMYNP